MKKLLRLVSFSALCLLLQAESCSDEKENKPNPTGPPISELVPEGKTYSVDPEKEFVIKTENGTVVTIPAGSLTGPDGEKLSKPISVNFTEYLNTADIILSGINMKYDSAGQTYDFASGGMFNFTARTADGRETSIHPERPVQVSMPMESDLAFSNYRADESGAWEFLAAEPAVPNPDYRPLEKPARIEKPAENKMVFDWKVNTKKFPELAPFRSLMWQYDGESAEQDPENKANEWVFDENWSSVDLQPTNRPGSYFIKLQSAKKSFETTVRPVLTGSRLAEAETFFEQQMVAYKAEEEKRKSDVLQRRYTKKFLRNMSVFNPGTHNWDMLPSPGRQLAAALEIDFGKEIKPEEISLFSLPQLPGASAVIPFSNGKWQKEMLFFPENRTALLAILPNRDVAVLDQEAYQNLDFKAAEKTGKLKIKMINKGQISSRSDLNDIIEGL